MSEDKGQDLEFISDPVELDDDALEEVSGGGCGNGSGCCDGDSGGFEAL